MDTLHSAETKNVLASRPIQRCSGRSAVYDRALNRRNRLNSASVLVVGTGQLGTAAVMHLAAAGVGCIGLTGGCSVSRSGTRHHGAHDARLDSRRESPILRERILASNPQAKVFMLETCLTSANTAQTVAGFDAVVDCSADSPTRCLVSDACKRQGKPIVFGEIRRFEGRIGVLAAGGGPCRRCPGAEPPGQEMIPGSDWPEMPGILPDIIGCVQATEIIKHLLDDDRALAGKLLLIDARTMRFREMALPKSPLCPVCGEDRVSPPAYQRKGRKNWGLPDYAPFMERR